MAWVDSVSAGELGPIDDDDVQALLREQHRRGGAGAAGADDDDIVHGGWVRGVAQVHADTFGGPARSHLEKP